MRCTWAFCQEESASPKGSLCDKHLKLQRGFYFPPKRLAPIHNDAKAFQKRSKS